MSKILILSDSHGLTKEIDEIKERHKTEYMIHCGDSELDMDALELDGFYKVAGNCDFDNRFPNEQVLTIDGLTFFITHGHLHNVKGDLVTLSYRAEEVNAQVICFGHTHIAGVEQVGNQLFINPGSIRMPRNRFEKTYAIMEWYDSNEININFYTTDGEMVEDLSFKKRL